MKTTTSYKSNRFLYIFLVLLAVFLVNSLPTINALNNGQKQKQEEEREKIELNDLQSMTQEELELICVERGFELIQDDETGEELTHADFVDAARRCLAIEEEMNEILEQNPELADELLLEIDRMKDEKEQLEQARQRMMAQKAELEQQLQAQSKTKTTTPEQTQTGVQPTQGGKQEETSRGGMWGTSSTASPSSPQPKQSVPASSSDGNGNADSDRTAFVKPADPQSTGNSTTTSTSEETTEPDDDLTIGNDDDDDADLYAPAGTDTETDPTSPADETTAAATEDDSSNKGKSTDFSLKGFLQEIMNEFEKDVHRITSLILPVVKPMLEAGNFAWRYLKVIVRGAKRQMEKYQQHQSQPKEKSSDGSSSSSSSGEKGSTSTSTLTITTTQ